jgi:hypothetical protein
VLKAGSGFLARCPNIGFVKRRCEEITVERRKNRCKKADKEKLYTVWMD